MARARRNGCNACCTFGFTSLLVIALTLLLLAYPAKLIVTRLLTSGIRTATLLSPTAPEETWNRMVRNDKPGAPADMMYVYMYNITNLDAVRAGAKPHLEEVGPYVYRKWRIKEAVRFDRKQEVFFSEYVNFEPHSDSCPPPPNPPGPPPASPGEAQAHYTPPEEQTPRCAHADTVVTLNLPLLGVLGSVDAMTRSWRHLVDLAIKRFFFTRRHTNTFEGLFMRRTVHEMLFGYDDELISDLARIVPSLSEKARFSLIPDLTHPFSIPSTVMSTGPLPRPWAPPAASPPPRSQSSDDANPEQQPSDEAVAGGVGSEGAGGGERAATASSRQPGLSGRLLLQEGRVGAGNGTGWVDWVKHAAEAVRKELKKPVDAAEAWAHVQQPGWSYLQWHGLAEMSCWAEGHVENVTGGSDALQFPPGLAEDESVYIFVPELFRMAKLNVTGRVDAHGVSLFRYQPDDAVAAPDSRFYTEVTGLMNITACTAVGPTGDASKATGPQVLMSFPHFCHVDPAVAAQTTGVSPCNTTRHDLWLGVEPITGITMAAKKRLQVSSFFDSRYATFDAALRPTILPVFWAEESGAAEEAQTAPIKHRVYPALAAIQVLSSWRLYGVLGQVALVSIVMLLLLSPRRTPCPRATPGHAGSHTLTPGVTNEPVRAPHAEVNGTATTDAAVQANTPAAVEAAAVALTGDQGRIQLHSEQRVPLLNVGTAACGEAEETSGSHTLAAAQDGDPPGSSPHSGRRLVPVLGLIDRLWGGRRGSQRGEAESEPSASGEEAGGGDGDDGQLPLLSHRVQDVE